MRRHGLVLDPVAAIEIAVLIGVERLGRSLPRPDLLVVEPEDGRRRVQAEPAADVRVRQARPEEERRRVDRARGGDDGPCADLHRPRVDADGGPALDEHASRLRADDDPRAGAGSVLQPRQQRRLLRAERAPVAAVAADDSLVAADHVPRHRVDVPPERLEPSLQHLVAPRRAVVVGVDAEALADGVQARAEVVSGREAELVPLCPYLVRRPERRRVVDDRPTAQAGPGDQADPLVVRRRRPAAAVEAPEAGPLGAVEVAFRPVAARLEDDDVEPGGGEHGRRDTPAGARADHTDVALELEPPGAVQRLEARCRRVVARPERPRVADLLPPAGEHVRVRERRLPERLEAGAHQRDGAVAPPAQHGLPAGLREP